MFRWFGRACVLVTVAAGCAAAPPPRSEQSPLLGDVAPTFESTTLNGNPLYSTAFHGHPFVVAFVAARCAACETTLAAAQAAYVDFSDVPVVGVFGDSDAESASAIASKLELRFPIIVDADGAIGDRFAINAVPRTFVVDPNGRIRWVGGRDLSEGTLTSALRSVK